MNIHEHYRMLERMYHAAPINKFFIPQMTVSEGKAVIVMSLHEKFHHAGGAVHGAVYFKILDDAAYFAANSLETEVFLLTTTFTTYLTRPISEGEMKAVGKVVNSNQSQFIAEAIVYDSMDKEIGRGSGIFVRSKKVLIEVAGYV